MMLCHWISLLRWLAGKMVPLMGVVWIGVVVTASASELKILDSAGLVRAVKVVKKEAKVVLTLRQGTNAGALRGECVATNIDGLAAEQRVSVSAKAECIFAGLSNGSWQITVPQGVGWKAQIYE